jgi:hypothetical protein
VFPPHASFLRKVKCSGALIKSSSKKLQEKFSASLLGSDDEISEINDAKACIPEAHEAR